MTLRFGAFSVIPSERRVLRNRELVVLTPKAFDVLLLLTEKRPDVVSKKAIIERAWGTYVTDAVLTNVITQLRRALDDSPERQEVIRTVHRVGYAFAAEAVEMQTERRPARLWLLREDVRFQLHPGYNTIGRNPSSDVWLDSPTVSWDHARVTVQEEAAVIEDVGSRNGTCVGGRTVTTPTKLTDGNVVRLGQVTLTFRAAAKRVRTETIPRRSDKTAP
jgi:DNA-binding winged helix-turn-helix (wHTH) protein